MTGGGSNRELNLDRIPAEMIERIEILRSPSAELDSQGVAGTINIVLKAGKKTEDKGNFRLGMSRHSNGESNDYTEEKVKPNAFVSYGDRLEKFSYFFSAYTQGRYNPKDKIEKLWDEDKNSLGGEQEWDNRDSLDRSFYTKFDIKTGEAGKLTLFANLFTTDRTEEQHEFKNYRDSVSDPYEPEVEYEKVEIDQRSTTLGLEYAHTTPGGNLIGFNLSTDSYDAEENAIAKEGDDIAEVRATDEWEKEDLKIDDSEIKAGLSYTHFTGNHTLRAGLQGQKKERDAKLTASEFDGTDLESEPVQNGTHKITENRLDLYAMDDYQMSDRTFLQGGLRIETTNVDQEGEEGKKSNDYTLINPSIHYKYALGDHDQLRASLARTVRRPNFDEMVPFAEEENPTDIDITRGNPELKPELSTGLDLGYEHNFADQHGVFGLNAFYRQVDDVIEKHRVADYTDVDPDGSVYSPDNVGSGKVWGLEFDSSFPLSFLGAPTVNFFANATLLDSEIEDPFTQEKRRFNDQSDYIYNLGLDHNLRSLGLSYGFSYQQRGKSKFEDALSTEETEYEPNLEAFVQYQINNRLKLSLTGNNLLDAQVDEHFKLYDSIEDKKNGVVKEYELESERSGAVYMITLSGSF